VIPQGGIQPLYLRYSVVNGGDCTRLEWLRQVQKRGLKNEIEKWMASIP
jgi:hypothetical protein